jgi:hypothetical protein
VFKYKGTSKFDVLILGQNAVEINYDPSSHTYEEKNDNIDYHSDDQSVEVEILD